jgi:CheY-like chemotaxis protein
MASSTLNLRDLVILIADSNSYFSMIVHGILRSFGANKVIEVKSAMGVIHALNAQKIDILLCDARLPPHGGLSLTRAIRRKADNENRIMPILVMSGDTRETTIKQVRDTGANMVIAKPMSPASLYDRLAWIALTPRQFVETPTYFGPDRRFKTEGYPSSIGRRKGDHDVMVADESGPAPAQGDIGSLPSAATPGKDDALS